MFVQYILLLLICLLLCAISTSISLKALVKQIKTNETPNKNPKGSGKTEILNLLNKIKTHGPASSISKDPLINSDTELGQIAFRYNKVLEELTLRNTIIKLLFDVASKINSALTPEEALSLAVNHICQELNWNVGHVFIVHNSKSAELKSNKLWYLENPQKFSDFITASENLTFTPGKGLPGKTFQEAKILWANEFSNDDDIIRGHLARKLGLQSTITLPIYAYENIVAVLEFFSDKPFTGDQQIIETLEQISIQISQVIERCLVHENLLENEEKVRLIVETSLDAVIMMDDNNCITVWNKRAEEIFGWSRDEVIGGKLFDTIVPHCYRNAHEKNLANYLKTGIGTILNKRVETRGLHKNGHEFPIELAITPIKSGKKQLFSAFLRDISERKRVENELIRAKEAAEESTRSKSTFLANISHEIRTPMNGILGMTELLLETPLDADQREYITTVKNCTESLLVIIDDVLDFSKIEAGRIELEHIPFNLKDRITHLVKLLEPRGREKNIEFVTNISPDIPDVIMGDPYRLGQVIINLIGNAIKFTSANGAIILHVSVEYSNSETTMLHFAVTDSGIGIPEDKQQLIFAPFVQADVSTTREYGGTGLGLAISSRLVELLGGKLWVKSKPGIGTVFHFTTCFILPQNKHQEDISYEDAFSENQNSFQMSFNNNSDLQIKFHNKVLLVEDNLVNQRVATILLEKFGLEVVTAEDGEEALKVLAEHQDCDLVLMDCQMPNMDGYTATKIIREQEKETKKHLPIIALTAHAMDGDRERCLEAGMDDYVTKPIKSALLGEVLQRFL